MSAMSVMGETRADETSPEWVESEEPGGERNGTCAWMPTIVSLAHIADGKVSRLREYGSPCDGWNTYLVANMASTDGDGLTCGEAGYWTRRPYGRD
jgi:hypothetical protein